MNAADRFSGARVVRSASAPRAEDRPEPPRLAGEHGRTARPDATADYVRLEIAADHRKSGTFRSANFELHRMRNPAPGEIQRRQDRRD